MRKLFVAGAALVLSACAVGPDYQRPSLNELGVPDSYRGARAVSAPSSDKQTPAVASLAEQNWESVFTDPQLQELIREALSNSPDALSAAARVREAEASYGVSRASLFPHLSGSISTSPTTRARGDQFTSSFMAGASVSWEIDLWGRYRRAAEAAQAEVLSSDAARYGVETMLIANVASYYYQLAMLHDSYAVTMTSANNQREVLHLVQRLSAAGLATAAEERQQETTLGSTKAQLPKLRIQIAQAENALSVLIGRAPGALRFRQRPNLTLPGFIAPGLPSALLARRPDVMQAEANLMAANARVGEARAKFFPTISLTGIFGGVSTALSKAVLGGAPLVASLGPDVVLPLFQGGSIFYNEKAAEAKLTQALQSYRKAILTALGEVSNSLNAYENNTELLVIQAERVFSSREALRLAQLRFKAGTTDLLEVLDSQRQLLTAETDQVQSMYDLRNALIQVYLALGGGWQPLQAKTTEDGDAAAATAQTAAERTNVAAQPTPEQDGKPELGAAEGHN